MQLSICLKCSKKQKRSCFNLPLTKNTCMYSLQIIYEIQKKFKRTHFNLWRQNICTCFLKMFCKIQRSNLTKKITLFIFDIKNVCTYSSNIKLKRYDFFSLLANYSIETPQTVCKIVLKNFPLCPFLKILFHFSMYLLGQKN